MGYVVDDDALQSLDDALPREPGAPLAGGTGRIVDWREVDRWWREAKQAQERADQVLDELAREVGWSAIVEALHWRGVLRDDRWDD